MEISNGRDPRPTGPRPPIRILYIGGYGRSGSTLLERLLGEVDGVLSVGEMRHVWNRSFGENQPCACGLRFGDCDFWSAVTERAFGGLERVRADEMIALKRSVDRLKYLPLMARPRPPRRYAARFDRYADVLVRLYGAIRDVSGCRLIVDSSKDPSHGMLLCRNPAFDVSLVHLVRDSRAVAYSWLRKKEMPGSKRGFMRRYHPGVSALRWNLYNYPFDRIRGFADRYEIVRYEDFVDAPGAVLKSVLAFAGEGDGELPPVTDGGEVELGPNHSVSGNPVRFARGPLKIRADVEWKDGLPARHQRLVRLLTAPLMRRYGYR